MAEGDAEASGEAEGEAEGDAVDSVVSGGTVCSVGSRGACCWGTGLSGGSVGSLSAAERAVEATTAAKAVPSKRTGESTAVRA